MTVILFLFFSKFKYQFKLSTVFHSRWLQLRSSRVLPIVSPNISSGFRQLRKNPQSGGVLQPGIMNLIIPFVGSRSCIQRAESSSGSDDLALPCLAFVAISLEAGFVRSTLFSPGRILHTMNSISARWGLCCNWTVPLFAVPRGNSI